MIGYWLVVFPLLLDLNKVTLQPVRSISSEENLDIGDCCPCPNTGPRLRVNDQSDTTSVYRSTNCPCLPQDDADTSPSILQPALRALQPFVKQTHQQTEPKPLLQPEVGLASSVLETLQKATDEEYQDALARDAARSAVKLIESDLSILDDSLTETTNDIVNIFINPSDDMDDNLPEPSHIQETRCIHSPFESGLNMPQLRTAHPPKLLEFFNSPRRPEKKFNHKSLLHKKLYHLDSGLGASNIQERVLQPDAESNLQDFRSNTHDEKNNFFPQTEDVPATKMELFKPKINFKIRDLIDKLNISALKEKNKFPNIDLNEYLATSTKLPPFKVNPIQKSIFRSNKPSLKDLLKLKDVELIPRKNFLNSVPKIEPHLNPNLKLRAPITVNNNNENYEEEFDANVEPSINNDVITSLKPFSPKSNSETMKDNEFLANNHNEFDFVSDEGLTCSENIDSTLIKLVNDDSDYDEIENENQSNMDETLTNNDSSEISAQDLLPTQKDNQQHEMLEENKNSQLVLSDEDMSNEESINNLYQIELLEDLDFPMKIDNSTLSEVKLKDTDSNNSNRNKVSLATIDKNINDFEITKQKDECLTQLINDNNSEVSNPVNELEVKENELEETILDNDIVSPKSVDINVNENNTDVNAIKEKDGNTFFDTNKDLEKVRYQDLQEMSDSILNLSECSPISDIRIKTVNDLNEINADDVDTPILTTSTILDEENTKEIESTDEDNLGGNSEINEILSVNPKQSACESPADDDATNNFDLIESNEIIAEPTKTDSTSMVNQHLKLDAPKNSFRMTSEDVTNPKIVESTPKESDTTHNKYSNIIDNLKLKLANIFSTTEKIPILEDNVNESSNVNPFVTHFDDNNINKFRLKPHTSLRKTSPTENSGLSLNSYRSKLAVPKSFDEKINLEPSIYNRIGSLKSPISGKKIQKEVRLQNSFFKNPETFRSSLDRTSDIDRLGSTFLSNSKDFLNSPLELSSPFEETLDPSSQLGIFSEKLRSHTENTLQNLRETLGSGLDGSQIFNIGRSTDTFEPQDILESISSRRDEMNEKLQAIHSDINDRFSAFQQSVIDQLNLPAVKSYELHDDSSKVERAGSITSRKKSPLVGSNKQNLKSFLPYQLGTPKESTNAESTFKSPVMSDVSKLLNTNKVKPNFKQNVETQRPGINLRNSKAPDLNRKILENKNADIKKSFVKPPLTPPKYPRTKIDSKPRLNSESSILRQSKIPILSKQLTTESKPLSMNKKNIKPSGKETLFEATSPAESLVDKLKEALSSRNQDLRPKNHIKMPFGHWPSPSNLMTTEDDSDTVEDFRKMKDEKTRPNHKGINALARNRNNGIIPQTQDATHSSAQNIEKISQIDSLKENTPYKCKLICYRDD